MKTHENTISRILSSVTETSLSLDGISLCLHAWSCSNTFFPYSGKYPVVILVLKGEYTNNASMNHFVCPCGTVLLVYNPKTRMRPNAFVDEGTKIFSFELTPEWSKQSGIQLPPVSSHTFPKAGLMNELMFRLYKEYKLPDEDTELAVHTLLVEIILFLKRELQATFLKIPNWVPEAHKIIEKQFSEKFTLLSLAKTLKLDYTYLSDAFFQLLSMIILIRLGWKKQPSFLQIIIFPLMTSPSSAVFMTRGIWRPISTIISSPPPSFTAKPCELYYRV